MPAVSLQQCTNPVSINTACMGLTSCHISLLTQSTPGAVWYTCYMEGACKVVGDAFGEQWHLKQMGSWHELKVFGAGRNAT